MTATAKEKATTTNAATAKIEAQTDVAQPTAPTTPAAADVIGVSSSLFSGIKFTHLESVKGGCFVIPRLNQTLSGKSAAGILQGAGSSILCSVPKNVWAEIKAKYSSLPAFTHNPPFLRELKSKDDYKSTLLQSKLKEMRTGAEPKAADKLSKNVTPASK